MITVLRLGHRPARDRRVTTHVALTARAFGADRVVVAAKDASLERTVRDVVTKFGGPFEIETGVPWRGVIEEWHGSIVHLTMYGEPLDEALARIPREEDLLIVLGATKVPRVVFERATFNVSLGNQPHSEVAALAVFLDRFFSGRELKRPFEGRISIVPAKRGKVVVEREPRRPEA